MGGILAVWLFAHTLSDSPPLLFEYGGMKFRVMAFDVLDVKYRVSR